MSENLCSIEIIDGWLFIIMPDGKRIPGQRNVEIIQKYNEDGYANVTLTLIVKVPE